MLLTREDGRVTMLTSDDATITGRTVFCEVSPDGHRWVAPWGKTTFGADGFHVLHHTGARLDLGGIGGLPAPLDALSAYATLSAPIVRIEGTAIALGATAGIPDAIARSTPLVEALTALSVALTAVAAALPAIATTPSGGTAASTAATAIGVATALIASTVPLIPCTSTTVT